MTTNRLQDKCRGSLIGGAIGDALGYAVEFSSLDSIKRKYGKQGITEYELNKYGTKEQMTERYINHNPCGVDKK